MTRSSTASVPGTTWSGTHRFRAAELRRPTSIDELRQIIAESRHVRAIGSRHSFNDVADTSGTLLDLSAIAEPIQVNLDEATAWVSAGTTYGEVARVVERYGLALHNMGSLPHISVVGAITTGTHGSGDALCNLSTAVTAIEIFDADGDTAVYTNSHPFFAGMVISLGALGIVTRVRLSLVPSYRIQQTVFTELPWPALYHHFDEITSSAYSVSLFTRWSATSVSSVWLKSLPAHGALRSTFFGASPVSGEISPLGGDAGNTTSQQGSEGPWLERLPHFRLDRRPSDGDEIQSEFFIERSRVREAMTILRSLGPVIDPLLLISEIRTVAADDLWLSPAYQRESVALHFTWHNHVNEVRAALAIIEKRLEHLLPRSHWGKVWTRDADAGGGYPRFEDFRVLRDQLDPDGRFANEFTHRIGLTKALKI